MKRDKLGGSYLKFKDLGLIPELLEAVQRAGFEEATPIQEGTIPLALEGKDVIGQAQTGTGKTAAFGLPMLQKIDTSAKEVQGLVIAPTRELAIQTQEELYRLGRDKKVKVQVVYGGADIGRQIRSPGPGAPVLPGPPVGGRAPRMVHGALRRVHRLRGEPSEEVPGHLPAELRQRPRGHLPGDRQGGAHLDRPRRDHLPRRQPAHQAAELLAAAAARDPRRPPRGAVPGGGLHPPGDDAHPGQDRLPPVLHLFRLAQHQVG